MSSKIWKRSSCRRERSGVHTIGVDWLEDTKENQMEFLVIKFPSLEDWLILKRKKDKLGKMEIKEKKEKKIAFD